MCLQKSIKLLCISQLEKYLILENIRSTLFTARSGGVMEFIIDNARKKVMKILALNASIFFGALIYLQSQSIIAINWDILQFLLRHSMRFITNSTSSTLGSIGLLLTGGLSAGLLLRFTKG